MHMSSSKRLRRDRNRPAPHRGTTCSQFRRETPTALRALIGRYSEALEQFDDISLPDLCFTAARGRVHFAERFTVVGSTIADLRRRSRQPYRRQRRVLRSVRSAGPVGFELVFCFPDWDRNMSVWLASCTKRSLDSVRH